MNKLEYCYHTHTKRCGHAVGEDEDYVRRAISFGYRYLGFSDHVMLPGISQPGMRGDYSLADGYYASIRKLERTYADEITIRLGYEAEWYGDRMRGYYESILNDGTVDYLIIGQHNFLKGDHAIFYGSDPDREKELRHYTSCVIEAMRSHLFLYLAHPDHFMIWYKKADGLFKECSEAIIEAAIEEDVPLEINMGPSRWWNRGVYPLRPDGERDLPYPYPEFWDMVAEKKDRVKVIIGCDAHAPEQLVHSDFDWAKDFADRRGLNVLTGDEILKLIDDRCRK
jgi:histidinol-phosphatase (PHP family)